MNVHNLNRECRKTLSSGKYEFSQLEKMIKKNINYCLLVDYMEGLAESYEVLGGLYTYFGKSEKALNYLKKSENLIISEKIEKKYLVNLYNTFVVYYIELVCDHENAIKYCREGIVLSKKLNMNETLSKLTLNMGVILLSMGEFKDALSFSFSALDYYLATDNLRNQMFSYSNIANTYCEMNDLDKAYVYFKKVYYIANEINNTIILSDCIRGISRIEFKKGNKEKACFLLEEVIERLKNNGNHGWEIDIRLQLIEFYIETGKIEEAKESLYRIEKLIESVKNLKFESKIYFYKSKIMEKIEDYKNAYFYHKKYFDLNQKLKNQESISAIDKMMRNQMEKTIKELNTIADIGKKITSMTNFENIVDSVYSVIGDILDAKVFGIGILEDEHINFRFYLEGHNQPSERKIFIENPDSFIAKSARENKELIIKNLNLEYKKYVDNLSFIDNFKRDKEIRSVIILPLKIADEVVGTITAQNYYIDGYSPENIETLRIISSYIAIAFKNSRQAKDLEKLAITDTLTGIYNRRYFNDKLLELFNKRKFSKCEISLMIIDIDYFKSINDTYGHKIGDLFLKKLSEVMTEKFLQESEFISRIGGEEFAVVFYDKNPERILGLADSFRESIEILKLNVEGKSVGITVSIGISDTEIKGGVNPDILFKNSDDALYNAKSAGRNSIIKYK